MQLKNTKRNYGVVAKWIHWVTALLFLGSYITVYYRQWFTERGTPENWNLLQLHLSIGVSVGVIVLLRIVWRLMNETPAQEPGSRLEHFATHTGHVALYLIIIAMPVTGYLGTGANTDFFFLFEIPKFENTQIFQTWVNEKMGLSFKEFEKAPDFIHKALLGEWLVWILIVGHASAALFHHFVKQDRTFKKMTTGND